MIHKLDCLKFMRKLDPATVGAVVTDPPYGIKFDKHGQIFARSRKVANDHNLDLAKLIYAWCKDNAVPLVMFYSPFRPRPGKFRSVLVWNKGAHVGAGGDRATCWKRDFELIGVAFNRKLNGQRDSAVVGVNALSPPPTGHVCEKPVRLMEYLIQKVTDKGQLVFDPCCGSGSTGVAAIKCGRKFVGCEVDDEWHAVASKRVAKASPKSSLGLS